MVENCVSQRNSLFSSAFTVSTTRPINGIPTNPYLPKQTLPHQRNYRNLLWCTQPDGWSPKAGSLGGIDPHALIPV